MGCIYMCITYNHVHRYDVLDNKAELFEPMRSMLRLQGAEILMPWQTGCRQVLSSAEL